MNLSNNIRIFKSRPLIESLNESELGSLVSDFKLYKLTGQLPDTFGRDVPYDHPNTMPTLKNEDVRHIHLLDEDMKWQVNKLQFYRTSDTHLVYCQGGVDENCYLLIAILSPNAHEQARNNQVMFKIAIMAENFRRKF